MRYIWLLRIVEHLGIRRLYAFMAKGNGERMLPCVDAATATGGWTQAELDERRASTRYFGNANLARIVIYLPILYVSWTADVIPVFSVFVMWSLLHAACAVMEIYKGSLSYLVTPDPEAREKHKDEDVAIVVEYFFSPKPWETVEFYTLIGVEFFRFIMTSWIESTKLSRAQRESGQTVHYVESASPAELLRFEAGTRVAESIHWIGAVFDLIPLGMALYVHRWWWAPFFLWMLWGDTWCAFLQRYHRVRVWKMVEKLRERNERRKAREGQEAGA